VASDDQYDGSADESAPAAQEPAERRTRALERANDIEMGHVARNRAQPDALGRRLPAFVSSTAGHLRGPVDPQRQTDRRALRRPVYER